MTDIAYRHPPGIQADNHRIQTIEAPLPFTHQARGERARPIPRNLDLEAPTSDITVFFVVPFLVFERACPLAWPFSYPQVLRKAQRQGRAPRPPSNAGNNPWLPVISPRQHQDAQTTHPTPPSDAAPPQPHAH